MKSRLKPLKKWWKENGQSIVVGVVLGLSAIFGWQAWTQHQDQVASQASLRYEKMAVAIQSGNVESAVKQGEMVVADWPKSSYAALASLDMAKSSWGRATLMQLKLYEWVLANADDHL